MMPLTRHLEVLRQKPEPIRKQLALAIAAGITAVIALLWLGASVASGAFALKDTSFADATSGTTPQPAAAGSGGGFGAFIGAAGAALSGGAKAPQVEVVNPSGAALPETQTAPTPAPQPTVLPF